MTSLRKKYIGDRAFYRRVLVLMVPMIIQEGVTQFVNLLDNVMVGALGTEPMSGVSIVNQLVFVFNLMIFGGLSGASIYGAQFFGMGDYDGMRRTTRFKLLFSVAGVTAAIAVFRFFGVDLVRLFLENDANKDIDIAVTLGYARDYLSVILWGLVPFAIVQAYSSSLRETGQTTVPMLASVAAIAVNLTFNYLLIFGHMGFPAMGVTGAAIATVMSRYVELLVVVIYTHTHTKEQVFAAGLFKGFSIPGDLARKIAVTGAPLLLNEFLWALGTTFVNHNYSTRGLSVVAAMNITVTAWQLFCIVMFASGSAVSILVGQQLGAGNIDEARDTDRKLIAFCVAVNFVLGIAVILLSPVIPLLYNTEDAVRDLASNLLTVAGAALPVHAFVHVSYFTIRSGGKTVITFLFDCVYTWAVTVTLSFILCRHTALPVVSVYAIVQFADLLKLAIAVPLLRSGVWAKNLVKK